MVSWAATQAKARFSEVLNNAEEQGPQRIQRRKRSFVLLTEEQYAEHATPPAQVDSKPFVSAWDAMRPSFDERYEIDFPRLHSKPRSVDLE